MKQDDLTLTSPQVADVIGVSPRMPTLWAERRYLSPSVMAAEGRGSKRLWNRTDTVHALLVKLLINHLSSDALRLIAYAIDGHPEGLDARASWHIPLNGKDGVLIRFYEDGEGRPSYQRRVKKVSGITGITGEGGKPDSTGDRDESEAGVVLVVHIGRLHEAVEKGIEKLGV
jgi:hypothetical protein